MGNPISLILHLYEKASRTAEAIDEVYIRQGNHFGLLLAKSHDIRPGTVGLPAKSRSTSGEACF